ncbi:hypothetical protein AS156_10345 [Bradyrhizobium macuxiense]|uniref:Uncharacterized protein n=1 Tax=Bradyrhizobium macuxiense TaxID=1755647 RepID=A0A109JP00_9BRAD|nr:hypothetical protein [Bradyrhizobium macuxiense]KWV52583.1 hypothetical protein AS156_10345 [Bradyrhizobium macuxiense]
MPAYSIVRVGNEYIVQAGEKSILKIASRRRAVKLVTDAAELLVQQVVSRVEDAPSISCDSDSLPDTSKVP